jgi:RNA polymerase sigma-70 factor, ECF subfamily
MAPHAAKQITYPTDTEQVQRALAGEAGAFRAIMQIHNQRLCRIARSILRNNADAEDAVQEAYVSAFTNLASYRGEGSLKSWLSRIVVNESLGRMRQSHSTIDLAALEHQQSAAQIIQFPQSAPNEDPERTMAQRQVIHLVEQAADNLPEAFRLVFVTRVIEGMSIEETAELLGIKPETVKTRLFPRRSAASPGISRTDTPDPPIRILT